MERESLSPPAASAEGGALGRDERRREREAARERGSGGNMLPARGRRQLGAERALVRLVATVGVIGVDVALGAILTSSGTQGWIVGLVTGIVAVVLSAILWSSRQL